MRPTTTPLARCLGGSLKGGGTGPRDDFRAKGGSEAKLGGTGTHVASRSRGPQRGCYAVVIAMGGGQGEGRHRPL
jgi:hypothetical protein